MRLAKIPRREWSALHQELRNFHYYTARVFVPGTEEHRALLNEHGIVVGAVSYSIETDRVRVYSLGSMVRGGGTQLMNHVERVAQKRGVPVRLAAERAALGFYLKRGYTKIPGQKKTCKILYLSLRF